MSWWRTLLAAIALTILASLVWLDAVRIENRSMAAFEARTLLGMGFEEFAALTLDNRHGHFTIERRDDGWWLTEPIEARADQERVFTVLSNMADAKRFSAIGGVTSERLADYGLDDPITRATFRAADGRAVTLHIGAESPSVHQFFATEAGTGEVFTVTGHVPGNLDKTLLQLRDRRLFTAPPRVTAIIVTAEGAVTRVERDADDQWWIAGAERRRAHDPLAHEVIETLTHLRAADFPDRGAVEATGLDPAVAEYALLTDGAEVLHLRAGLTRDVRGTERFARVSGRSDLLTVATRDIAAVPTRPLEWLDRDLLHLVPAEVGSFSLTVATTQGDQTLTLERGEGDTWRLAHDPTARLNERAATELLMVFDRLVADAVVIENPDALDDFGLAPPALTFSWQSRDGLTTEQVEHGRIADPAARQAYLRRGGEPLILSGLSCYAEAQTLRRQLMDRRLVTADLESAARILAHRGDRDFDVQLREGMWTWVDPERQVGLAVPAHRVAGALSRLANAEFTESVTPALAENLRAGFDDAAWVVTVWDAADAMLTELRCAVLPSEAPDGTPLVVMLDDNRLVWVSQSDMARVQQWVDLIFAP